MTLRVTKQLKMDMDNLGYENLIKETLGYNFVSLMNEFSDVDDMTHDQLRRHIERLNNDMIRFKNQLLKKINEELYFFNNCYNIQKYINELKKHAEASDTKLLYKYYMSYYKDVIDLLTYKYEGLKTQTLEKNKKHMKDHASEEIICDCGASVCRRHIARHRKTEKHLHNMPILDTI